MSKTVSRIWPCLVGIYSKEKQVVWVGSDLGRQGSIPTAVSPNLSLHATSRDKYRNQRMADQPGQVLPHASSQILLILVTIGIESN
jgi:hypothetical protein